MSFSFSSSTDCWTCSNRILCTRRQRKVWIQHSANCKSSVMLTSSNFFFTLSLLYRKIYLRGREAHYFTVSKIIIFLQIVSHVVQLKVESHFEYLSHRILWTVKTPLVYLTCRLTILTGFALHSMRWGPARTHPVTNVCQCVCLVSKRHFCCSAVPLACKRSI